MEMEYDGVELFIVREGVIYVNMSISDFYDELIGLKSLKKTLLIGIDGGGGAGKSTLARRIEGLNPTIITVVHMDDFYKPSADRKGVSIDKIAGYFDWKRVEQQVLIPLSLHNSTSYQRYDWDKDQLAEWHSIEAGNIIIIEGCYSLLKEIRHYYGLKIWVDSPKNVRLSRGIERDGEEKRYLWEDIWMPGEEHYKRIQNPIDASDIVIDGSGIKGDIEKEEIVIIKSYK